ncbi:MAG: DUF6711 family protein [Clostridia bacterium]
MQLLNVDGLVLNDSDLSEYKIEYNKIDGDGTKRNLSGTMRRQVVANKIKITIKTRELIESEKIKGLIDKVTKDTLILTFVDTKTNVNKTISCYCNAPSPELDAIIENVLFYKAMSISFIEL